MYLIFHFIANFIACKIYKENDLVAIKRTQSRPGLKFAAKYFGPYRIKQVLRNDRYVVQKIGEGESPSIIPVAADHMKPWSNPTEDVILEEDITSEGRCRRMAECRIEHDFALH